MALVSEHHLLEHLQKVIRAEGQGRREAHRFASAVFNDPILTYRLRELRVRSQERPRRQFRPRPPQHPHARQQRNANASEPRQRCPPDEPYEPYEEAHNDTGNEPSPPPKRRRSERQRQIAENDAE